MLWAQCRSSQAGTAPLDDIEIETALANLQSAGRVTLRDGAFRITTPERRLVGDDWLARVGGLTHQLASVSSAAVGRFFNDDDRAFARTVSLRVRTDRLDALETLYRDHVWPTLKALDAECIEGDDSEVLKVSFSLCWSPEQDIEPKINHGYTGD